MKAAAAALGRLLKRYWVLTMVVVALAAGFAVVSRLRTFFDSDQPYVAASQPADVIRSTNVKRVTYEVVGPAYSSGRVSYLDVSGKTVEARFTSLPWSVTVSTTDPGVLANVVAQGDTEALGCRILVNDKLVA